MVDITNIIIDRLDRELNGVKVVGSYQSKTSQFPTVSVVEIQNNSNLRTKDSGGFHHSNVIFQIEIFTIGDTQISQSKRIRRDINNIMSGEFGMARSGSREIPNFLDESIYRYVLNYSGTVSENREIYRG